MKNYCTNQNAYFNFKESATIKRALNKYNDLFNNPLGHMSQEQRDEILLESKKMDPKPAVIYGIKKKKQQQHNANYKSMSKDDRQDMN
jgi:hypothetical protein